MLCTWYRPEVSSKTRAGRLRNINIVWNWSKSPNQTMDKGKRQRSKNFSDFERTLLKQIVLNHPIIENKQHDSATENKKKTAWTSICNEFNSNEKVSNRTLQQLQVSYCIIVGLLLLVSHFEMLLHFDPSILQTASYRILFFYIVSSF